MWFPSRRKRCGEPPDRNPGVQNPPARHAGSSSATNATLFSPQRVVLRPLCPHPDVRRERFWARRTPSQARRYPSGALREHDQDVVGGGAVGFFGGGGHVDRRQGRVDRLVQAIPVAVFRFPDARRTFRLGIFDVFPCESVVCEPEQPIASVCFTSTLTCRCEPWCPPL
jgi:hypothetical protein